MFLRSLGFWLFIAFLVFVQNSQADSADIEERIRALEKNAAELRELLNSAGERLNRIVLEILRQNYEQAGILVHSNELSIDDWKNIVEKVYYGRTTNSIGNLVNFGLFLEMGTDKLMLYLTLRNQIENTWDPKVWQLFALRKENPFQAGLDKLSYYEPYSRFFTLEQDVITQFKNLLTRVLTARSRNSEASNILKNIHWDKLTKIALASSKADEVVFFQSIVNQTLLENYHRVDISFLIDRIELIDTTTEYGKIEKVYLYGALHYAIHTRDDIEQPNIFKLAYSIKNHLKTVEHKVGKEYFTNYVTSLLNSFHGCVQSIVNHPDPKETSYLIKNVDYDEYLYIVQAAKDLGPYDWKTTPKDLEKSTYRPVFTWILKDMDVQGKFNLSFKEDRFWIQSGRYEHLYLNSQHKTNAYTYTDLPDERSLQALAVRIIPSRFDSNSCFIENYRSHRAVYAGPKELAEDETRRTIFTDGVRYAADKGYHWSFSTYEKKKRPADNSIASNSK